MPLLLLLLVQVRSYLTAKFQLNMCGPGRALDFSKGNIFTHGNTHKISVVKARYSLFVCVFQRQKRDV